VWSSDPTVTEALCDSCDFLWIDLEHSAIGIESLQAHLIAARAGGAPAIVRVPSNDVAWTKRVLDSGAEGVILPQATTVAEVRAFAAACRSPPRGRGGFAPRRGSNYGGQVKKYLAESDEQTFVAVQIETCEAFEALDEIASIKKIDSLVVGPADLAGSMLG